VTVLRAHKIKLAPTKAQAEYFAKACGVARFSYNWGLSQWKEQYKAGGNPSYLSLNKQLNAIKAEQFPWMSEVTKAAPQAAIKNLGLAFKNFFRRVKQGKKPGYPRFKKKGRHDSFRADGGPATPTSHAVQITGKVIKLPKIGLVRMREELRFSGRVMSTTVSHLADGWYVSILVDTNDLLRGPLDKGEVGVDLGLKSLAVLSTGEVFPALKPNRAANKRLIRLSRGLSRKQKGSSNRAKAKTKLAKLHKRIADVRADALHKLTNYLATRFSMVCIEDLNVSGMVKNHRLARSVSDASFAEFRRQLEYKAGMTGAAIKVVDRFFPSSKTCYSCGKIHEMALSHREMVCGCGYRADRDLNAALNIRRQALAFQPVERIALADTSVSTKLASEKQETGQPVRAEL
jgi:putative transposase